MKNAVQLNIIQAAIGNITDLDDMSMVYKLYSQRMKYLQRRNAVTFNEGDKVYFDAGRRGVIYGVVTKVNSQTVKVFADGGLVRNWKVSASCLKRA